MLDRVNYYCYYSLYGRFSLPIASARTAQRTQTVLSTDFYSSAVGVASSFAFFLLLISTAPSAKAKTVISIVMKRNLRANVVRKLNRTISLSRQQDVQHVTTNR